MVQQTGESAPTVAQKRRLDKVWLILAIVAIVVGLLRIAADAERSVSEPRRTWGLVSVGLMLLTLMMVGWQWPARTRDPPRVSQLLAWIGILLVGAFVVFVDWWIIYEVGWPKTGRYRLLPVVEVGLFVAVLLKVYDLATALSWAGESGEA
jgi:hypothetical protein